MMDSYERIKVVVDRDQDRLILLQQTSRGTHQGSSQYRAALG